MSKMSLNVLIMSTEIFNYVCTVMSTRDTSPVQKNTIPTIDQRPLIDAFFGAIFFFFLIFWNFKTKRCRESW